MSDQPDAEISTRKHTTLTRDRHPYPCPRLDSNPQPQQANGRRQMSYIARPMRLAVSYVQIIKTWNQEGKECHTLTHQRPSDVTHYHTVMGFTGDEVARVGKETAALQVGVPR
jgi:hypothetical protein